MNKISVFAGKYIDYYFCVYLAKIMIPFVCIRAWVGLFNLIIYPVEMILFLILFGTPFIVAIILSFFVLPSKEEVKKNKKSLSWHIKEILKGIFFMFIWFIITGFIDVILAVLNIIEINEATIFISFFAILFTWPTIKVVWETIKTKGKNFILNNNDLKTKGGV